MTFKTLATASAALLMLAGSAIAQTPAAPGAAEKNGSGPSIQWASEKEQAMYEKNRDMLGGFFTDDTMSTVRSGAEVKERLAAMTPDQQNGLKTDCQSALEDSKSYGSNTSNICTNLMGR